METLEKSGSRERKKILYKIKHYQSDLCPNGTLTIRFQTYQAILSMYCAENFTGFFSLRPSPQNVEQIGVGVRSIKNGAFKCSIFTWKESAGYVRFSILRLPISPGERCRPISSWGPLSRQVHCQENSALGFAGAWLLPAIQVSDQMSLPERFPWPVHLKSSLIFTSCFFFPPS